ncbi:hypothetical protein ABBQ38_009339 [Trebouxia sp. C0009 RCD-2024]
MQAKKAVMMAVLHAVPATLLDAAPLVRQPPLLKGFHEALKALPDSPERLSGLALSVRLCISKNPGEPFALLAPLTVALPYCDEARRHGLFDLLHTTLEHVLEAPAALLKLAIMSLAERAKIDISFHRLQPHMHLVQVAQLEFIASLQPSYPLAAEELQAVLLRMLPQYQDTGYPAAGFDLIGSPDLRPPTYDSCHMPELQLPLFQSTLLSQVRMEDMQRDPELAEAAYASCMKWFVDTVTSAMRLEQVPHPSITGTVMTPYLKLMRIGTSNNPKWLPEICLASLQFLYLLIKRLVYVHQQSQLFTIAASAASVFGHEHIHDRHVRASVAVEEQQATAKQKQLTVEVHQLKTCLVKEVLPMFQKMSKDSSWASAMAAMEPDEWCWQNPRQYPVQDFLDSLCKGNVMDDTDVCKARIFFNWSKRVRQAEAAAKAAKAAKDAEDKALKACEELLAEEQQQHAQAAAKQAKKQRQKAKKRQEQVNKQAQKVPQDLPCHQGKPQHQAPQLQPPQLQTPQQQSSQLQLTSQQQSSRQQSPQQPTTLMPQPPTPRQLTPRQQIPQQHSPCHPTSQQQDKLQDNAAAKPRQAIATPHKLLCCPITKVLMTDPVIAADGYTYERAALLQRLQHSLVSPVTGNMLEHTSCVPNAAIKSLLHDSIC